MPKARYAGTGVSSNHVLKSRSVVYTQPKLRRTIKQVTTRDLSVKVSRDVQKYLAWLDS